MSANPLVSPNLIEQFQRDGFVVVPNLLTESELEKFGAAVDRAVRDRGSKDNRKLTEKSLYEQSFTQCINLWEDHPDILPLTFHPKISEAAATLIGVPKLRLWHDQALYKEAGGRYTEPHQDQPYWPMDEPDTLTAWIPFDGSTRENGCMGYVPGSHQVGLKKFINIFTADESVKILEHPAVSGVAPIYVEVPRGSIAFHHGLTIHMAMANKSNHMRRVHTMIYFRDGATRAKTYVHPSVDRPGIKVGELIDSDLTPLVWPRDPGDLPKPPRMPLTEILARLNVHGALPDIK
jgi:ectoine hydroxylase-related dioxygenase (phytanoyl-CoA dioxygenase family)